VGAGVFRPPPRQTPHRAVGLSVERLGGTVTVKIGDDSLIMTHR
jgi:hypothetical protein